MIKDENQSWGEFFFEMIVLLGVVLFLRFYVFQFFRVSGPSMCPTLNVLNGKCQYGKGEFIFVNEFLYNFVHSPQRGEVVVFHPPEQKVFYIKRILGVAGDTIEIKNGRVFLSNEKQNIENFEVNEPYLSPLNKNRTFASREKFVVPKGYFFLVGDNRGESLDARRCFSGAGCNGKNTPFVPQKNIKGRSEFVVWPFWGEKGIRSVSHKFDEPISNS
jgi:signal peptidase I